MKFSISTYLDFTENEVKKAFTEDSEHAYTVEILENQRAPEQILLN